MDSGIWYVASHRIYLKSKSFTVPNENTCLQENRYVAAEMSSCTGLCSIDFPVNVTIRE